jgi:hypothetical protein
MTSSTAAATATVAATATTPSFRHLLYSSKVDENTVFSVRSVPPVE